MSGYSNRVIKLDFPALSEDWETDPVWIVIRNPRLLPPSEIQSFAGDGTAYEEEKDDAGNPVLDEDGRPKFKVADPAAAQQRMRELIARLTVAARVYDGTAVGEFNPETGEPTGDQPRLPATPWTPDIAAKLPLDIIERISREYAEAMSPKQDRAGRTAKTSSGPPSPSTTAPGVLEPSPQN